MSSPQQFAVEVVRQLRAAGYQALFAGGCVRDQLLGSVPKDYDVATDATPDQVIAAFPNRKTLAIGAAFGVIAVVGPRGTGVVEVATFRRDLAYTDGRRPDGVEFCSPEEDAERRDFTINGMFYDPIEERVLDYVGGQEDLRRGVIRAIGDPHARFTEDKLRLLRAVRFTARLEFQLDEHTKTAIQELAPQLATVSVERISDELRKMLIVPRRAGGVRLLRETNLLPVVFPEWEDVLYRDFTLETQRYEETWSNVLAELGGLDQPSFPLALAVLLAPLPGLPSVYETEQELRKLQEQEQEMQKTQEQLEKGQFTLVDFRKMYDQIRKLGSMSKLLDMIPGMGGLKKMLGDEDLDKSMARYFAIIDHMTEAERLPPHKIDQSRRESIAAASGTQPSDVDELLRQFDMMAGMMKDMAGKGMGDRMAMMKEMQGMIKNPGASKLPRMKQHPTNRFVQQVGRRLKLSNDEIDATSWLVRHQNALHESAMQPWSAVQPLLIMPWASALLHWSDVRAQIRGQSTASLDWCRERLAWPREQLDPPPLLTGDDLIRGGIKPGPHFTGLLAELRAKQLDGQLTTTDAAWEWVRKG